MVGGAWRKGSKIVDEQLRRAEKWDWITRDAGIGTLTPSKEEEEQN